MSDLPINSAEDALQAIILECSDPHPVSGGTLALVRNLAERGIVCEKARQSAERHTRATALTPAQESVEELVELARTVCENSFPWPKIGEKARDLLAKIDPPKAPTYEETLKALAATVEYVQSNVGEKINGKSPYANALDILDRARRAGVMP